MVVASLGENITPKGAAQQKRKCHPFATCLPAPLCRSWHFPGPTAAKGTETELSPGGLRPNNHGALWTTSFDLYWRTTDAPIGANPGGESSPCQMLPRLSSPTWRAGITTVCQHQTCITGGRLVPWTLWSMPTHWQSSWSSGLRSGICSLDVWRDGCRECSLKNTHWKLHQQKWCFTNRWNLKF